MVPQIWTQLPGEIVVYHSEMEIMWFIQYHKTRFTELNLCTIYKYFRMRWHHVLIKHSVSEEGWHQQGHVLQYCILCFWFTPQRHFIFSHIHTSGPRFIFNYFSGRAITEAAGTAWKPRQITHILKLDSDLRNSLGILMNDSKNRLTGTPSHRRIIVSTKSTVDPRQTLQSEKPLGDVGFSRIRDRNPESNDIKTVEVHPQLHYGLGFRSMYYLCFDYAFDYSQSDWVVWIRMSRVQRRWTHRHPAILSRMIWLLVLRVLTLCE